MCLLQFTMPQRELKGTGSRQSLQRLMQLAPLFLHSDREGAFTAFSLLFQILKFCSALDSGQPLSHRLCCQICKDLQDPRGAYFSQNDISILEVIICISDCEDSFRLFTKSFGLPVVISLQFYCVSERKNQRKTLHIHKESLRFFQNTESPCCLTT